MKANRQAQLQVLSDFVVELRYRAIGRFLDRKGEWADQLSQKVSLPIWTIGGDILEVRSETPGDNAFLGLKRAGFHCMDVSAKDYFADRGSKFLRALFSLEGFPSDLQVERVGVRSRFFYGFGADFAELRKRYSQRYFSVPQTAMNLIGGEIVDIGGHLDFKDAIGNFNTMSGPMKAEQARELLGRSKDLVIPPVGLFYDIDYWKQSIGRQSTDQLDVFLHQAATAAWERAERIRSLLFTEGQ